MFAVNALVHNFIRIHSTIKTAPAVAAGLIEKPMTVDELVTMFEAYERRAN